MLYIYATQREEIREQFAQGLHRQVPGSGGKVMNYLEQLVEQARQEGPGRGAGNQRALGAHPSRVEHYRIGPRDRSRSPADTEQVERDIRSRADSMRGACSLSAGRTISSVTSKRNGLMDMRPRLRAHTSVPSSMSGWSAAIAESLL